MSDHTVRTTNGKPLEIGDVVTMSVTVKPKWWQFWKKPHVEKQAFVLTAITKRQS